MSLETLLRVKKVQNSRWLSQLSVLNARLVEQQSSLDVLSGFVDTYSIDEKLSGRKLKPSDMTNHMKLVSQITKSKSIQTKKVEQIQKVLSDKLNAYAHFHHGYRHIENVKAENDKNERLSKALHDSQLNQELFQMGRRYVK